MSTNTYDVNFLRHCSPREVTVCLFTESEYFCTARAVAMDMKLIQSPRSRLIYFRIHNIRPQKRAIMKHTNT
jgi:hypothetical protein